MSTSPALFFLLLAALSPAAAAPPASTPAAAALAKIRGLAGEWSGTYEWSGGRTGAGTLSVAYSVTGRGSQKTPRAANVASPRALAHYICRRRGLS